MNNISNFFIYLLCIVILIASMLAFVLTIFGTLALVGWVSANNYDLYFFGTLAIVGALVLTFVPDKELT